MGFVNDLNEDERTSLQLNGQERVYTVSELVKEVDELVYGSYPLILLKGEVSNPKQWTPRNSWNGTWLFFTIKDPKASLDGVIYPEKFLQFNSQNILPQEGVSYLFVGHLRIYQKTGRLQFVVEHIVPEGEGLLFLKLQQLIEKLEKEGLFEHERKKPLPLFFKTVGIITSIQGAAIHDVLKTLYTHEVDFTVELIQEDLQLPFSVEELYPNRQLPLLHLVLFHSTVQGEKAVPELMEGLGLLEQRKDIDIILLTRGGGSLEDLWCFNSEELARSIAQCSKPVLSAVGHEKDTLISDLVADLRLSTPTQAGMHLARHIRNIWETIQSYQKDIESHVKHHFKTIENELLTIRLKLKLDKISSYLEQVHLTWAHLAQKFETTPGRFLKEKTDQLHSLRQRILPGRLFILLDGKLEKVYQKKAIMERIFLERIPGIISHLDILSRRLHHIIKQLLQSTITEFQYMHHRWEQRHILLRYHDHKLEEFMRFQERFSRAFTSEYEKHEKKYEYLKHRFIHTSPQSILNRGYTLTLQKLDNTFTIPGLAKNIIQHAHLYIFFSEGCVEARTQKIFPGGDGFELFTGLLNSKETDIDEEKGGDQ